MQKAGRTIPAGSRNKSGYIERERKRSSLSCRKRVWVVSFLWMLSKGLVSRKAGSLDEIVQCQNSSSYHSSSAVDGITLGSASRRGRLTGCAGRRGRSCRLKQGCGRVGVHQGGLQRATGGKINATGSGDDYDRSADGRRRGRGG